MARKTDQSKLPAASPEELGILRRLAHIEAREDFLTFIKLTMPDSEDPDDPRKSGYRVARHHECIAYALEEVEKGKIDRLIITLPPRHGKSRLCSNTFPAWFMGKNPRRQLIFATYNEDFASDFGKSMRTIMRSEMFEKVFPGVSMRVGSQASDKIQMEVQGDGGLAAFVGIGGSTTGRGADCLIVDDPVKNYEDVNTKMSRDKMWDWFNSVAMTRLLKGGRAIIIMTRWHEDDIVGRITDPTNPCFDQELAKGWKVLSLPAIAEENDPLKRKIGDALWPDEYPLTRLDELRRSLGSRMFSALYQGNPTPDDGVFITRDIIRTYGDNAQLPKDLRIYAASDHAISTTASADPTCMGCVGVDPDGNIWVLPDLFWKKAGTMQVVDGMLRLMKNRKPLMWKAEKGHISQSIGPFLRKRMHEEQIYCMIDEVHPSKDKLTRAQAIHGRMAQGRVFFPKFAYWWPAAEAEMLKFPHGRNDDFVDFMALIGMVTEQHLNPPRPPTPDADKPARLTFGKLKRIENRASDEEKRLKSFWN